MKKPVLVTFTSAAALLLMLLPGAATASVLDLGSSGQGFLGGAYFSTTDLQPTGTGVFDPFLTVQNSPSEQGYNATNGNFDTKRVPQWNHEILLSDLRATTIGGIQYYGFIVDINEPNGGGQQTISVDGLKIFTSSTIQSSTSTDANGIFNGSLGTQVFDLGSNNSLHYTDQQHGSGSGDINIFIPVSDFANARPTDYVYMYQLWGNGDLSTQGGFEETALMSGAVPVPELTPGAVIFGFLGLIVAVSSRRALVARGAK